MKKLDLMTIKDQELSREEMKNIMAGSGMACSYVVDGVGWDDSNHVMKSQTLLIMVLAYLLDRVLFLTLVLKPLVKGSVLIVLMIHIISVCRVKPGNILQLK